MPQIDTVEPHDIAHLQEWHEYYADVLQSLVYRIFVMVPYMALIFLLFYIYQDPTTPMGMVCQLLVGALASALVEDGDAAKADMTVQADVPNDETEEPQPWLPWRLERNVWATPLFRWEV